MRRAARVAMVLLLVAATGCRSASTPEPEVIAWRETPVAATIVTLASEGEDVLVGVEADGPGVLRVHDGRPQALQLAPATAYGQRARWLQISSGAAGMVAVGGARGGAHANVRWTAWDAAPGQSRLREREQTFETFGGWDAGSLAGVAQTGGEAVIIGSWAGTTGLDGALWRRRGDRWTRVTPTPAVFASSRTSLVTIEAVAGGTRLVALGDRLALTGERASHPTLWAAPAAGGPWSEQQLPGAGRGRALGCAGERCLVVLQDAEGVFRAGVVGTDSTGSIDKGFSEIPLPRTSADQGCRCRRRP